MFKFSSVGTENCTALFRNVMDFESDFESVGFCRFFTNSNPWDLQTCFLSDLDLIFVLNFRKINCCPLTV